MMVIQLTNIDNKDIIVRLDEQNLLTISDALHIAAGLYFQNLVEAAEIVQLGEKAVGEGYEAVVGIQNASIKQISAVQSVLGKLQAVTGMDLVTPNSTNYEELLAATEEMKKQI